MKGSDGSVSRNDDGQLDKIEVPIKKSFFENLPELIKANTAAELLNVSIKTLYDWKYRAREKKIPEQLFVTIRRNLYLRTSILREWISQQNPHLFAEGEKP